MKMKYTTICILFIQFRIIYISYNCNGSIGVLLNEDLLDNDIVLLSIIMVKKF